MQITTPRLVLREFTIDDWPAVLAYQQDPDYLRLYPWNERTENDAIEFVNMFLEQQGEIPRRKFQLAITFPDNDQAIGNCGIRRKADYPWEADVGYELAPEYWGQGYATEAAQVMVRFGFQELNLHRISSWCLAENVASAKVLAKLGLRREGRLRENMHFKGRWWDTLLYGVLASEWEAESPPLDRIG